MAREAELKRCRESEEFVARQVYDVCAHLEELWIGDQTHAAKSDSERDDDGHFVWTFSAQRQGLRSYPSP